MLVLNLYQLDISNQNRRCLYNNGCYYIFKYSRYIYSMPPKMKAYSLYSTTTSNFSHWGFAFDNTPNVNFCIGHTNMLVSKNTKICVTLNANAKICVTPNVKPKRKQVEYRSCWVPKAKFSRRSCTFLFLCRFYSRWVPFFSGIWA